MCLSADLYANITGKKWSAVIRRHHTGLLIAPVIWERHNMPSEWHAETAMEAAWQRHQAADAKAPQHV